MKEIPLGNGLNTKVDDEDYEWLSAYSWYVYSNLSKNSIEMENFYPAG